MELPEALLTLPGGLEERGIEGGGVAGDHSCIDAVGLGKQAGGLGKGADMTCVEQGDGEVLVEAGEDEFAGVSAGRLAADADGLIEGFEMFEESGNAWLGVGPTAAGTVDGSVEGLFSEVDADFEVLVFHGVDWGWGWVEDPRLNALLSCVRARIDDSAHATIRTKRGRQESDQAKDRTLYPRFLTLPVAPPAFLANSTTGSTHRTFARK